MRFTQSFLTINFDFGMKYMILAMKFHEIVMDTKIIKSKIVSKTNSDQLS